MIFAKKSIVINGWHIRVFYFKKALLIGDLDLIRQALENLWDYVVECRKLISEQIFSQIEFVTTEIYGFVFENKHSVTAMQFVYGRTQLFNLLR